MQDVKINGVLCREKGLILTSAVLGSPEIKTATIEIPGRDGVLDCTEKIYGRVLRNNRKITLTFKTLDRLTGMNWIKLQESLTDKWHGQPVEIVFMDDPEKYFEGRLEIKSFEADGALRTIQIEADCKPYPTIHAGSDGDIIL